jgi:hypothetical protein
MVNSSTHRLSTRCNNFTKEYSRKTNYVWRCLNTRQNQNIPNPHKFGVNRFLSFNWVSMKSRVWLRRQDSYVSLVWMHFLYSVFISCTVSIICILRAKDLTKFSLCYKKVSKSYKKYTRQAVGSKQTFFPHRIQPIST